MALWSNNFPPTPQTLTHGRASFRSFLFQDQIAAFKVLCILFLVFMYLAAPGLSCSMENL